MLEQSDQQESCELLPAPFSQPPPLTQTADTNGWAVIKTALSVELVMSEIDWQVEHKRFMDVAYNRTLKAAKRAFSGWHISKQTDSVASCVGKMWDQWSRLLLRGRDPEPMLSGLIRHALLFVCTFPENTEPAATGQGVVSADFSTPTGERPSRARRGSPR